MMLRNWFYHYLTAKTYPLSAAAAPTAGPDGSDPTPRDAAPATPRASVGRSMCTDLERLRLDAFVAEPGWLAAAAHWPLDFLQLGDVASRRFAHARLEDRRFAADQVKAHGYRPLGARGPIAVRSAQLCPPDDARRGRGVIPPDVRVVGDITATMLSPYAALPEGLHVDGSMTLDAELNPEPFAVQLPKHLWVAKDLSLRCRSDGPSFTVRADVVVGDNFLAEPSEILGASTEPAKDFWDIYWAGSLEVGKKHLLAVYLSNLPRGST